MTDSPRRAINFNAGPAALPLEALERAQRELCDFAGTGMSIMEHSHRGKAYEAVHHEAMDLIRRVLGVPDDYDVLLLQGGARQQFAMVPMNLLSPGASADYLVTGTWAKQALAEARLIGTARAAANTEHDGRFTRIPDTLDLDPSAAYVHLTSNNTLFGTQWASYPDTGAVPLVADMTSDLASRPIDVSRFGLIYAGAQKNVGPAGVTVVIVQKSLVEAGRDDIPEVFRYRSFAKTDSLWNTPPCFAIYMLRNTLAVLEARGGVEAMAAAAERKSSRLYALIDAHPDFFRCPVEPASRSRMNVVWRLPTEELEQRFLAEASARSMVGLKGHRSVGGLRASLYDFVEEAWVDALAELMDELRRAHG
ncbi:MAG: 3-phosphoserine/phosphohydroxythreonine transaminase [Sandaracinaceae bacterium]|nr:3-phosphoserine/phosphohydroxythreonine transaminase [Sandaracinaceae bacterium]